MARLSIALLGSPSVEVDGAPLAVDTRKAIALLAYLAVTGQAHGRDTLATLLWPEYDQEKARASLRRTLSALRQGLGPAADRLDVGRERIGLRQDEETLLDVELFTRRLAATGTHGHGSAEVCPACVRPLSEAAEIYRGDFLAGFALRDCLQFEEWQRYQAESLRHELAGGLERLVEALGAQGLFDQAIGQARRWLTLDPLHEPAHRRLMLLHAWAGERAAALRQYRECVRVLAEELGVPPLAETTELAEAIKENRLAARSPSPSESRIMGPESLARPPPAPAPHEPGPLRLPLVGRAGEWATLVGAYEAAREGGGRLVVLEGEAGIGKTRLAEDFLAQARSGGAGVVAARCYEGESGLAYGPFAEGLRAALAHPEAGAAARLASLPDYWPGEAARLVPELGALRPGAAPAAPLENTPGAQVRFLEGVSQVLAALVGAGGILFLDDAHWADQASLDLLTYLVRRLHTRRLYVLVTWRGEQVPPDHRLRRLLADARRAGTATAVSLSRLTASEVAELVRAASAAGAELPQGLGGALYQETEGLPFFLVEYLRQVLAKGEPPAGRPLPRGVRELLRARLAEVSETGAQLLTTAAVVGRSFGFEIVRDASGRGDDEAVAALEELLARGLVRELEGAGDGRLAFDFAHDRLRELVYEETSLVRRRLLHRRVAEALRGRARGPWDVGAVAAQVAHHYRLAGQEADAAEYFRLAGEHARGLYANAEALAHFGAALALGHPDTAALHEMIGDLQTLAGAYAAARASYEHAAALAGEAAPRRLAALEHKLGELYRRRGEWDLAESHFEAARAALGEEERAAGDRARLAADWSLVAHRQGEPGRALVLARRALALAEAADDPRALAQVHNLLGILAGGRGEPELAGQHLERSLALADRLGDPSIRAAVLNNMALAHGRGGDLPRALELAEAALALCAAQGDRHREAALHNNLADLLHAAGRTAEAMTHLKQAVSIFAEIGWGGAGAAPSPEVWKLTEW